MTNRPNPNLSKALQAKINQTNALIKEWLGPDCDLFYEYFGEERLRTMAGEPPNYDRFMKLAMPAAVRAGLIKKPQASSARKAQAIARAHRLATQPALLKEEFMKNVTIGETADDCWIWEGPVTERYRRSVGDVMLTPRFGAGRFADPPTQDARHYIYEAEVETLPAFTQLTMPATCQPRCVNPNHIIVRGRTPQRPSGPVHGDET